MLIFGRNEEERQREREIIFTHHTVFTNKIRNNLAKWEYICGSVWEKCQRINRIVSLCKMGSVDVMTFIWAEYFNWILANGWHYGFLLTQKKPWPFTIFGSWCHQRTLIGLCIRISCVYWRKFALCWKVNFRAFEIVPTTTTTENDFVPFEITASEIDCPMTSIRCSIIIAISLNWCAISERFPPHSMSKFAEQAKMLISFSLPMHKILLLPQTLACDK